MRTPSLGVSNLARMIKNGATFYYAYFEALSPTSMIVS